MRQPASVRPGTPGAAQQRLEQTIEPGAARRISTAADRSQRLLQGAPRDLRRCLGECRARPGDEACRIDPGQLQRARRPCADRARREPRRGGRDVDGIERALGAGARGQIAAPGCSGPRSTPGRRRAASRAGAPWARPAAAAAGAARRSRAPAPCRRGRRARFAAPRAERRSRPGRRGGGRAADGARRRPGTSRPAARSGPRAPPPGSRSRAWGRARPGCDGGCRAARARPRPRAPRRRTPGAGRGRRSAPRPCRRGRAPSGRRAGRGPGCRGRPTPRRRGGARARTVRAAPSARRTRRRRDLAQPRPAPQLQPARVLSRSSACSMCVGALGNSWASSA